MSDCCSPSSSVASPLWIWTCSSCASEERWWWDTRETRREGGRIILDAARMTQIVCVSGFHTPRSPSVPWLTWRFFSGEAQWMDDVLWNTEERKRETLQPCKTFYKKFLASQTGRTDKNSLTRLNMDKKPNRSLTHRGARWAPANERSQASW